MSDLARRLRAQKRFSTDPDYLERMAREAEAEAEAGVAAPSGESADADSQLGLDLPPPRRG
jgi:hypothetical protein